MESQNQIKTFQCNIHPGERIQRVCLDAGVDTSLRCIECILSSTEKVSKEAIVTLNDFVEHAAKQYETFRAISTLEDSAPNNLVEFLSKEGDNLANLSQHVEAEKARVSDAFNTILQEFTILCHSKKEEIFRQFDKQLHILKLNYEYYKSKIDRYYNKDKEEELNPNKEAITHKINQCNNTNEVEVIVKNIKDEILDASNYKDQSVKIRELKEGIGLLAEDLKRQSVAVPKSSFSSYSEVESTLKKFRDTVNPLMEEFTNIEGQLYEFSLSQTTFIDSKIIKKAEEIKLLKKWVSPTSGNARFKLLYRASRDGFDANVFHKKCDNLKNTLTIVRAGTKRIFGGFAADLDWNLTNNYKQSTKTWLFSIDEKEKYPIRQNNAYHATYTNTAYGPTFGGGHDLMISLNNVNGGGFGLGGGQQSYSNLGHSYEIKNGGGGGGRKSKANVQNNSLLAGSYNFTVEECEVFQVDTSGQSLKASGEFESEILSKNQDVALVKNWIARGKKIDLELLYRGTTDGFSAQDFHNKCDGSGANLVVVRTAGYQKVFGGYTSKGWSQVEDYVADKDAFVFSVSNSTKHTIVNPDCAIFCTSQAGPVFGAGYDIFICGESNIVEDSNTTLGMTYQANDNLGDLSSYLGGASQFMVEEIEVFKVTIN